MIYYLLATWIAPIAIDGKMSRSIIENSIIEIEDERIKNIIRYDVIKYSQDKITITIKGTKLDINKEALLPSVIRKFNEKEFWNYMSNSIIAPGFVNGHTHSLETVFQGIYTFDMYKNAPFKYRNMLDWLHNPKAGAISCGIILSNAEKYLSNVIGESVWKVAFRKSLFDQISSGVTYFRDHLWNISSVIPLSIEESSNYHLDFTIAIDCLPSKNDKLGNAIEILNNYSNESRVKFELGGTDIAVQNVLDEIRKVSEKRNIGVHLHLSETKLQRKILKNKPLEILAENGLLNSKLSLAHAVYLTKHEYYQISENGASIIVNDRANGFLGSKKASLSDMIKAGVHCGLGTDGAATIGLDFLSLLNFSVCSERMFHEDPTVMDAYTAMFLSTYGSARTLGTEDQMGSIEVGKYANINVFKLSNPIFDPIDNIVFLSNKSNIKSVIIKGIEYFSNNNVNKIDAEDLDYKLRVISKFLNHKCCAENSFEVVE